MIFALSSMPLSYLYVRQAVTGKRVIVRDSIHLIPVLLYIVDLLPFFLLNASEKQAILSEELYHLNVLTRFSQGWLLPDNFHMPTRLLLVAFYWILQVRLVARRFFPYSKLEQQQKRWARWILWYFGLQLLIFLPALATLPQYDNADFFWLLNVPSSVGALLLAISVLLHPKIAYGLETTAQQEPETAKPKLQLQDEFIMQTTARLEQFLREKKPFLKPGYSIKELAIELEMPLHHLSAFINQSLGKNFNDLLNFYRIQYCQELLSSGVADKLNLHGLAIQCGFNNRNTFTIAFKKRTGFTPSSYLKLNHDYKEFDKPRRKRKPKKRKRSRQ